jgi:hypothetical protein
MIVHDDELEGLIERVVRRALVAHDREKAWAKEQEEIRKWEEKAAEWAYVAKLELERLAKAKGARDE